MNNPHGKRVLVTGAAGFIGSHLVERLLADGVLVRAFVRYTSSGDIGLLRWIPADIRGRVEIVYGDLRDAQAVSEAATGVDTVLHLGALIAIPYSYVHPHEVVETNVMGTFNVLSAVRALGIRRLVHTSTSEVYGTARSVPIDESHPLQGQSPYSASKIAADKIVESFVCSYGVKAVTVRPFNTFGPRQSARAVIPAIACQALFGDVVRLGDTSPTRDFTYVRDTVDAFCKAAWADGADGETINVGNDREISVGELANRIVAIVGRPVTIETEAGRVRPTASEVRRLHASNDKARRMLGWAPQTSLDAGLRETVEWIRQNRALFDPGKYTI
jgi:dTDP-glucose 4,6-dehydratase